MTLPLLKQHKHKQGSKIAMNVHLHKACLNRCILLMLLLTLLITVVFLLVVQLGRTCLIISSPREVGRIYYRIPIASGDSFTLTYRHSVSNSIVFGTFHLTEEGTILPLTTSFSSFGPGLPMLSGTERTTVENGLITVYHEEEPRDLIRLWVSPFTGETLTMGSRTINLAALSEQPLLVEIRLTKPYLRKTLGIKTRGQV